MLEVSTCVYTIHLIHELHYLVFKINLCSKNAKIFKNSQSSSFYEVTFSMVSNDVCGGRGREITEITNPL